MDNLFDGIQNTVFAVVANTMGYSATWIPSNGSLEQTAQVLFKDASETSKVLGIDYDPTRSMLEFKAGDFDGLKFLVDSNHYEKITVNDMEYGVLSVQSKYDGKTFFAELQQLS